MNQYFTNHFMKILTKDSGALRSFNLLDEQDKVIATVKASSKREACRQVSSEVCAQTFSVEEASNKKSKK